MADEVKSAIEKNTETAKTVTAKAVEQTKAVVEQTKAAADRSFDNTVAAVKDGMTKAASGFEASQDRYKEGLEKAMKSAEEVVAFNQGNVEAFIKSSQILMAGLQDLSRQFAESMKATYEESVTNAKALTSVKSLKEAMDLNVGLVRTAIEKSVSESGRYTDASFKLAEQTIAPLSSRVTAAVEKFGKTA
jgi:phasin family protein